MGLDSTNINPSASRLNEHSGGGPSRLLSAFARRMARARTTRSALGSAVSNSVCFSGWDGSQRSALVFGIHRPGLLRRSKPITR
jgi:hypothetical protein